MKNRILLSIGLICSFMGMNIQEGMGQPTITQDTTCSGSQTASGDCSVAIGIGAVATGTGSVSIGTNADASGNSAHVYGQNSEASAFGATAIGAGATASGIVSVAVGEGTTASGHASQAIGVTSLSAGEYSSAIGWNVQALDYGGVALGERIISNASRAYVFGTGTSTTALTNANANTLMMGMNSTVPSFYMTDASGGFSNIGIATTNPLSRLHVNGAIRTGASGTSGSLVFNHTGGNTVTFSMPTGVATQAYVLPTALGTTNHFLQLGASGQLQWAAPGSVSNSWLTAGNLGIDTNINYLGTIDAVDMIIRTNSQERIRVKSNGRVGIGTIAPQTKFDVQASGGSEGSQERIARFGVSDQPNAFFQIWNKATAQYHFAPSFYGISSTVADEGLDFRATLLDTLLDTLLAPVMSFTSRYYNIGGTIQRRPLFEWKNNTSSKMLMKANGDLGIGTTTPQGKLDVNGNMYLNYGSIPGGSATTDFFLGFSSTGQVLNLGASSAHFKENVQNIEFDKEAFLNLRPVNFRWKEYQGGQNDVGLVAQEVNEIFPALASWTHKYIYLDNGDYLRDSLGVPVVDTTQMEVGGVRYHKLPVYLLSIVKGQQQELGELRQQVQQLVEQVNGCCAIVQPMYRLAGSQSVGDLVVGEKDEFILLKNDPNPFSDFTDIQYEHDGCVSCEIIISDNSGRILKRINTNGTKGTVRVYSSEIGTGIFVYSLVKDGQTVRSEKMVSSNR